MLDALSPARRRFVLGVSGLVALLLLGGVVLYAVNRPAPVTPVSQGDPGPVLLVPGYGGSTVALDVLQQALENSGRDATGVGLAGNGTGDLREQARVLDQAAHSAMDSSGATSVDVVGYSAGGVIARLWVRNLGGGELARRVVTLGSPHHGTDLAGLAGDLTPDTCPVACRQLARDSDLLRALNAGDETPAGPRWVSIWTTDDPTVVPADSASLEGALDFSVQSVCPSASVQHSDLPRDPSVIAMTLLELGPATPALPAASDVCR
jgi:triacylglycerol esterase/lipase EstA (alpha/beta hydrolase family)